MHSSLESNSYDAQSAIMSMQMLGNEQVSEGVESNKLFLFTDQNGWKGVEIHSVETNSVVFVSKNSLQEHGFFENNLSSMLPGLKDYYVVIKERQRDGTYREEVLSQGVNKDQNVEEVVKRVNHSVIPVRRGMARIYLENLSVGEISAFKNNINKNNPHTLSNILDFYLDNMSFVLPYSAGDYEECREELVSRIDLELQTKYSNQQRLLQAIDQDDVVYDICHEMARILESTKVLTRDTLLNIQNKKSPDQFYSPFAFLNFNKLSILNA